jgi:hypothetical protein
MAGKELHNQNFLEQRQIKEIELMGYVIDIVA